MVEVGGVEPPSKIILISSHPQACQVYYHKPEKIDGYKMLLTDLLQQMV